MTLLDCAPDQHREHDDAGAPLTHLGIERRVPENLTLVRRQCDQSGRVLVLDDQFVEHEPPGGSKPFEVVSILLLAALVGAVVIARRD